MALFRALRRLVVRLDAVEEAGSQLALQRVVVPVVPLDQALTHRFFSNELTLAGPSAPATDVVTMTISVDGWYWLSWAATSDKAAVSVLRYELRPVAAGARMITFPQKTQGATAAPIPVQLPGLIFCLAGYQMAVVELAGLIAGETARAAVNAILAHQEDPAVS